MITIAKGRWLSDPIPWLKAAGSRPIAAMEAVINTERTLDFTLIDRIFQRMPLPQVILDVRYHDHAILYTDTEEGDKADTGGDREVEIRD